MPISVYLGGFMAKQERTIEKLIKKFPVEPIILKNELGEDYYACPSCKRHIAISNKICPMCAQILEWDDMRKAEMDKLGSKTATLTFEVPGDFFKANCRKCPISYITKTEHELIYDCPLGMRNNCPLEVHFEGTE